MDIRKLFAANLIRLRKQRGFSQEKLAFEAGVDRAHVSKIERSKTYVGLEIVEKFSKALDIAPAEFLQPVPRKAAKRRT